MKIGKRKISSIAAILTIALVLASIVFGAILYTLTISGTWNVNTSVGLQLQYPNGTQVTAISFSVSPLGTTTENFVLKNVANHAVNVTDNIPSNTTAYGFSTTFANSTASTPNTIAQGGTYAFSITLQDLGMDSTQTYSGNFAFNIVDQGPSAGPSSDTFTATSVNYASDTAQYFGFVSDSFNASSYAPGQTVLYAFTTQDINASYEIQGLSYKLQIYDSGNNLISTVCDGLVVAYWQNSTAYGTFGNGTHMTDVPLLPGASMTIWQSFAAPSLAGTYHLVLTYQSHNAAPLATPISWTTSANSNGWSPLVSITYITISGATQTGEAGTVTVRLDYNGGNSAGASVDFTVSIPELDMTIAHAGSANVPEGSYRIFTYSIPPLTTGGPLTMQVTINNVIG